MATIWKRGAHQFCVRVRRNGVSETKTFETRRGAVDWARIMEGKVTGEETLDVCEARDMTFSHALEWYEKIIEWYEKIIVPNTPRSAKGNLTQLAPVTPAQFDAAYLQNPRPAYPQLSRRLGEQGNVLLAVHVTTDGKPGDPEPAAERRRQRAGGQPDIMLSQSAAAVGSTLK